MKFFVSNIINITNSKKNICKKSINILTQRPRFPSSIILNILQQNFQV